MKTTVRISQDLRQDIWRLGKVLESETGRSVSLSQIVEMSLKAYIAAPDNKMRIEGHKAGFSL